MQAALRDLAGFERLEGRAAGNLEFIGAGASVDAIMRSLAGKGALKVRQGVIRGIDLDRLMQTGTGTGGTTVFDSLNASYTIAAGDLFNDDLLLKLTNFKADGAGRIGLGARDIDYVFTPVALRANAGKGLSIPVRIRGSWDNPSILPDLSGALEAEIGVKADELERAARDRVTRKLEQELDVTIGEDQDAEDVLKERLEDEAKQQLLKLLGQD